MRTLPPRSVGPVAFLLFAGLPAFSAEPPDAGAAPRAVIRGRLTLKPPEVSGQGVDADAFLKFVTARKSALQGCYEHALAAGQCFEGTAVVKLTVTPEGKSSEVEVSGEGFTNDTALSCFRSIVRVWVFPFKPSGPVHIVQRFAVAFDEHGRPSTCGRGGP